MKINTPAEYPSYKLKVVSAELLKYRETLKTPSNPITKANHLIIVRFMRPSSRVLMGRLDSGNNHCNYLETQLRSNCIPEYRSLDECTVGWPPNRPNYL